MIEQNIIDELIRNQQIALNTGNPPFAALIEYNNEIIASISNNSRISGNPLNHAEFLAIQSVIQNFGSKVLDKSHLYSTNEPCPMCIGARIWSGRFMSAKNIALADDSGICINGPVKNNEILSFHEIFWNSNNISKKKHSIHIV